MDFSDRMGFTKVRTVLQTEDMDDALRNSIWNVVFEVFARELNYTVGKQLYRQVWAQRRKLPLDECPSETHKALTDLKKIIMTAAPYQVYNLIEYIQQDPNIFGFSGNFSAMINRILEREMSGYRFVGDFLSPIISQVEIAAIEQGLVPSDVFKPVAVHLTTALELLSNREAPDYPNSIKESISAVEAACQIATGDSKATLGAALRKLEDAGVTLHEAFKAGLKKFYGFTSDAEGIRHALLDESTLEQADAIFMLVTCSAFANYLRAKLAARAVSPPGHAHR